MKNKKSTIITGVIVSLVFLAAIGVGVFFALKQNANTVTSGRERESSSYTEVQDNVNTITYQGQTYKRNTDIKTLLFLGVDSREKAEFQDNAGWNGNADCIILMLMNEATKETTLLEISRDSMVDVDVYTSSGEYYDTQKTQLCLQYAYGDGDAKSIWLMKKAVSTLLYNVPIDSCVALNLDGFVSITDALGGVELTIPEDYTYIEPEFVAGATVNLNGTLAERYVRYRDINVFGSNADRMKRQNEFLPALVAKAKQAVAADSGMYTTILDAAEPYMTSDLSGDQLHALASYKTKDEVEIVPGEIVAGEKHDEFHVNYEELQDLVVELFYKFD